MNDEVNNHRPPPSITPDTLKKVMWLYRTRTCPLNKRGQCNYGIRCFDSHESQPERRAPKQNEYNDWHPSTMKCTSNADESCKYGRACYFAHNDFEVNYHPTMYKTQLCSDFEKEGACSLGMICPNYHYPDEQRKIEKGSLSADCKSDGISRKAPPPQEFRRWLDEELRLAKLNGTHTPCNHADIEANKSQNHIIDPQAHLIASNSANGHNNNSNNSNVLPHHDSNPNTLPINKHEGPSLIQQQQQQQQQQVPLNDVHQTTQSHASSLHNVNLNGSDLHSHNHAIHPNTSNGIENEVEIELPSTQTSQSLNLSHSLMEDSPSTRFVSSTASSPYVEHIDEKWHQHNNLRYNGNNQSRPEHYIPSVPSASPHLNRALSTPTTTMDHTVVTTMSDMPPPSRLQHAHSHQGAPPSIASYRSNRSSNRSQKSGKSSKSKSSAGSKSKSKSAKGRNGKRKSPKHSVKRSKKRSRRKLEKHAQNEKQSVDIINSYKVTRCTKSKCDDVYCVNYHNLEDRRRSPLSYNYIGEACARIFDSKTRKFTDNCYGCPANENCEYAHNYLEIWYHPKVFHTKRCPFIKYQKSCPWGFKCSHYHKKAQKRSVPHLLPVQNKYSPQSSSQYSSHSQPHTPYAHLSMPHVHPVHPVHHGGMAMHTHGAPPNLVPTQPQVQNVNVVPQSLGPHRPPLTTNRAKPVVASPQMMSSEISSPYSANSFSPHSVHHNHNMNHLAMQPQPQVQVQQQPQHQPQHQPQQHQHQNGLLSPHFDANLNVQKASPHNHHQTDASYSYNPLMQGIAPSIHSWRQKMDKNVGY